MKTIDLIKNYIPKNEQEQVDKEAILSFIENNDDCLLRDNLIAHITSSGIVVNKERTKVLFAYHNIYDSWAWVGGHNDGDDDCAFVAMKEAKEETGINDVKVIGDLAGLEIIYVANHIKREVYVGDHLHLNLTFLLEACEEEQLVINKDENSGVKWFLIDEIEEIISEPRMKPIYNKYFNIIKKMKKPE